MIDVTQRSDDEFEVTVEEGGTSTHHVVTVDDDYHRKLTGGRMGKDELVRRSFEFLLQREPKESILSRFNLKVITRYFPSYEEKIRP